MGGDQLERPRPAPVDVGGLKTIAGAPAIPTHITRLEAYALQAAAAGAGGRYPGQAVIVEIGSAWGFSTVLMAQVAHLVIAVDPHDVWNTLEPFLANLERHNVIPRVHVIKRTSQEAAGHLEFLFAPVDLVFVDGDHAEASADHDIRLGLRLLRPGGILAVHDYTIRWPGVVAAARRHLEQLPNWRIQSLLLAVKE